MNRNQRRQDKKQGAPTVPAAAQTLFSQATQQHQAGRLAEAEAAYRQVLAQAPRHADALYLLGVLHHQTGRPAEAADLLGRAVAAKGDAPHMQAALGTVLLALNRPDDAVAALRRALALKPDQPEAHTTLGNALKDLGRLDEAVTHYERAIALKPDYANAHNSLGYARQAQGRLNDAAGHYRRALALNPRLILAQVNLGKALMALGDLAGAEAALRQALALDAGHADALNNLGAVLQAQGRMDEATACLRQAAALAPDDADAHLNLARVLASDLLVRDPGLLRQALSHAERALALRPGHGATLDALGTILQRVGRLTEAERHFRAALAATPDDAEIIHNLATTVQALARQDEAEALYRQALALDPDHADARYCLGTTRLAAGDLASGWADYEARWRGRQLAPFWRPFPVPQWRGGSLAGKRLLVWGEQGLGDEILFASLLPDLHRRVAAEGGQLVVECAPRLVGLIGRALPGVVVRAPTSAPGAPTLTDMDLHLPMGGLPGLLRPRLADWHGGAPFLAPRADLAALWRGRLDKLGPGLRVGISWRSGIRRGDRDGAYTTLADYAPVLTLPGIIPVTLQYSAPEEELRPVEQALGLTLHRWPDLDLREDIEGVAALTAALDLVITAPTAVGELAGALGVPCWRLGTDHDWSMLGAGARPWFSAMAVIPAAPQGPAAAGCVALAAQRLYALTGARADHLFPCPSDGVPI
ncbi:tetratricopeptide repeat protein [Nitrospirillum sp. BR 11164]|uniref:tetratricopeptide repeat protein n=1 Tax=Nitrospirillum sp. BR 11164 TaxID=3104324 RepID=UPI002AFFDAB7|nr:tetratricopeptide repeat protein [Nitrospirillum sp. BR 11164]MEA1652276.1 tetratricopeptide repeat protein [Nitrospirillum sp. BR 11164]